MGTLNHRTPKGYTRYSIVSGIVHPFIEMRRARCACSHCTRWTLGGAVYCAGRSIDSVYPVGRLNPVISWSIRTTPHHHHRHIGAMRVSCVGRCQQPLGRSQYINDWYWCTLQYCVWEIGSYVLTRRNGTALCGPQVEGSSDHSVCPPPTPPPYGLYHSTRVIHCGFSYSYHNTYE